MTCPQIVDSGVYVLGALAPGQRLAFERHMATCDECQTEVNDLAVLPGLLGRLDEPAVAGAGELPPPSVLSGVLEKIRRKRRGRRVLAFATVFAVACLALVAGLAMPQVGSKPATAVALHPMRAVAASSPISAQVGLVPINGGTRIELRCQYSWTVGANYPGEHSFALYVYPRDGGVPQQVGTWTAKPGDSLTLPAVTSWSIDALARIELRTAQGKPLLLYDVA